MTVLMSADQFRGELRAKRKPVGGVYRVSVAQPLPVDGAERTLRFCFSDGSVDRMNDTIAAAGWDLTDFSANPVALWAHDSSAPPIGGARNVGVEGDRLLGDIEFAPPETYAFADTIYRLVLGKFLRAVSVGFMPTRYAFVENDPERGFGIDFLEQALLEISVCPVPANPNALPEARRKGIDTRPLVEWAERTLDGDGKATLPRAELERLRRAAKEPTMTRPKPRRTAGKPDERASPDGWRERRRSHVGRRGGRQLRPRPGRRMRHDRPVRMFGPRRRRGWHRTPRKRSCWLALRRLLARRKDGGDPADDDLPVAHEDAIRLAHKCLRTSKAFITEGMTHHAKALSLLDGVVDALDTADPISRRRRTPTLMRRTAKGGATARARLRCETRLAGPDVPARTRRARYSGDLKRRSFEMETYNHNEHTSVAPPRPGQAVDELAAAGRHCRLSPPRRRRSRTWNARSASWTRAEKLAAKLARPIGCAGPGDVSEINPSQRTLSQIRGMDPRQGKLRGFDDYLSLARKGLDFTPRAGDAVPHASASNSSRSSSTTLARAATPTAAWCARRPAPARSIRPAAASWSRSISRPRSSCSRTTWARSSAG